MFIKVCGLKTKEQIDKAIEYGYDAIGVVTYPKSKRYCEPKVAIELANYAKDRIKTFVVGMTFEDVKEVADFFDYTQIYEVTQVPNLALSSNEMPPSDLDYRYFFYDASIGSGIFEEFPDWVKEIAGEIILSGGLNKDNICSVIRDLEPFGIDISSGVEKDGVKDIGLMQEFITIARNCK
jgi:phosphoribosylanthranilate isomerase